MYTECKYFELRYIQTNDSSTAYVIFIIDTTIEENSLTWQNTINFLVNVIEHALPAGSLFSIISNKRTPEVVQRFSNDNAETTIRFLQNGFLSSPGEIINVALAAALAKDVYRFDAPENVEKIILNVMHIPIADAGCDIFNEIQQPFR